MAAPERSILHSLLFGLLLVIVVSGLTVSATPRLIVNIPHVTLTNRDTAGVLTVWVNNYNDSLAGVELLLHTSDSSSITFLPILDTVGTILSKWEMVGVSPGPGGIHLIGLANATRFTVPPFPPSSASHPLIRLYYRVNRDSIPVSVGLDVTVDRGLREFGFSDPMGHLIGVVQHTVYDTVCYRCVDGTPEACNAWQVVTEPPCDSIYLEPQSVTELDTTQVIIADGSIYIPACCAGPRGNVNFDPQDQVDLTDLSLLISHLTVRPVVFGCFNEADVNGSGLIDLTDLSILIAYLLQGKALPGCPQ